ncbi:DUF3019 domain-containing protein [Pseudoalteromonas fenneropenaei]|uniref:DUF3019 domain-containing protein n=1 Tax=Pseudoalteromonas fenneropenaei TaxID=1737459 RepID=A0ABV7CK40_9GAMM
MPYLLRGVMLSRRYWLLLSLICHLPLSAQQLGKDTPTLGIKPSVCISADDSSECTLTIKLQGSQVLTEALCLYQDERAVQCWQAGQTINLELELQVEQQTRLSLRRTDQTEVAAQQLTSMQAQTSRLRRRLKNDWSFF